MIVAEVVRSGFVESVHHGSVAVLGGSGAPGRGDVTGPMFPRSALKPLQAVAMLRAGLVVAGPTSPAGSASPAGPVAPARPVSPAGPVSPVGPVSPGRDAELALVSGSHFGEPVHVRLVGEMLAAAGLTEDALQCPAALPLGAGAREDRLRAGGGTERILMNCSGKHAGMLATCVANGWPIDSYLDRGHPLQAAIAATVADLAGEPIAATGVDGCGAPVFAVSLTALARSFRRLVEAPPGSAERRVADAMRAHPELVAGTGGEDTVLMRAVPGLLSKAGAEGVVAAAVPDRGAVAVKIHDGGQRARMPVLVDELRRLGADVPAWREPVLGGGVAVGEVRAVR